MSLAVDNTASLYDITFRSSGYSYTKSFTMGSVSNGLLVVAAGMWLNGGTPPNTPSVKFGTQSMTLVTGTNTPSNGMRVDIWKLVAPTAGTANVTLTISSNMNMMGVGIISFSGADQTTPIDVSGIATGTAGSVTKSLTTTNANEYLIDATAHFSANTPSAHSGTALLNPTGLSEPFAGVQYAAAATAGSNSMSWTFPDPGDNWGYAIAAINPASGGGGGNTTGFFQFL